MRRLIYIAAVALPFCAHAGVYVESVRVDAAGKETSTQLMWVQDGMARVESRGSASIFKNDIFYALDVANKKYMAVDKVAMEQSMSRFNEMLEQLKAKSANLPPDQRAMLDQLSKQLGGGAETPQKAPVYDAESVGGFDTVNGRRCRVWNVTRDGKATQQLCAAPFSALPGAEEVASVSKRMLALFEKMSEQFREQVTMGLQQQGATLAKINGYPIKSQLYKDGKLAPEQFVVKTWVQRPIESDKFEIPKDFAKQEIPQFPAGAH